MRSNINPSPIVITFTLIAGCLSYLISYYFQEFLFFGFPQKAFEWQVLSFTLSLAIIACCLLGWSFFRNAKYTAYALAYNALIVVIFIFTLETLSASQPTPLTWPASLPQCSRQEINLQRLIERANTEVSKQYRGTEVVKTFDLEGWPKPHIKSTKEFTRIILIGDSLLEVRSGINLAERVQRNLNNNGFDAEVVNISQGGTSPTDYLFRLKELAPLYSPDIVFVFLYAGNDMGRLYKHVPYESKTLSFGPRAVQGAMAALPDARELSQLIENWQRNEKTFANSSALMNALGKSRLSDQERRIVVLNAHAWTCRNQITFPFEYLIPNTLSRSSFILDGLFSPNRKRVPKKRNHFDSHKAFQNSFQLSRTEHIEEIASIATKVHKGTSKEAYHEALLSIPTNTLEYILAEPDMSYFLWPALYRAAGQPISSPRNAPTVQEAAEQHFSLYKEMKSVTSELGSKLVFVLIPEASQVDGGFREFWQPFMDFRQWKSFTHALSDSISKQLVDSQEMLKLGDNNDNSFQDGYWPLDGHWNDNGNEIAAKQLADCILREPLCSVSQQR